MRWKQGGKKRSHSSHNFTCATAKNKTNKKTPVQMFYENTLMHFVLNLDMSNEGFKDIKKINV